MSDTELDPIFETIYGTDLVYAPGCWQLCGDAHCCSFAQYKSGLVSVGGHLQELPLLPGEYGFIRRKGWLPDFAPHEHRVVHYPLALGVMSLEFLVTTGRHACACTHATRTTACRLYPLTPIFDVDGRTIGVDRAFSIYEELERLDPRPHACQVQNLPFEELHKFLTIASAIGSSPIAVFYVLAYQLAKAHVVDRVRGAQASQPPGRAVDAFRLCEGLYALRRLFDHAPLRKQLDELAERFHRRYGGAFALNFGNDHASP